MKKENSGALRSNSLNGVEVRVEPANGGDDPALKSVSQWAVAEESKGRSFLAMMLMVGMVGLYAWALSTLYGGAHGGVDQNGYLMTARLIAGDKNEFHVTRPPATPLQVQADYENWAKYQQELQAYDTAVKAQAEAKKAAGTQTAARPPELVPPVATSRPSTTYAKDEPVLATWPQTSGMFDFIRNRLSYVQENPFQYAGRMDIYTEPYGPVAPDKVQEHRVYAKYPFGFPLLAGIGRMIWGLDGMYMVNPICTVLACYFAYFMCRQLVSPFASLMGVAWLACNPLTLVYANDANSHASTLLCVCVGFWGLLSWMRLGGHGWANWRGFVGGFALGYACTIRYSEFLLVLPVLFAAITNVKWEFDRTRKWYKRWIGTPRLKSLKGSFALLAGWGLPVAVLAGVCWVCFGAPWKTGYTYCREDTGFGWKYLTGEMGEGIATKQGNWETLVQSLNRTGLFVMWPFALAGMFALIGSAWRIGMTLALWVLPSTFLYMLYYWAPTTETGVGYLRFFLSVVPGLVLAGLWMLERGATHIRGSKWPSLVAISLFGLLSLLVAAMYAGGDQPIVGKAFFGQAIGSLWSFVWMKWGAVTTGVVLALIAGIWFIDRKYAATRVGLALGMGVVTALGCGVNVNTFGPQLENTQARWLNLRETVDKLREKVPQGSVLFADDGMNNQLDAVGGWKLYDGNAFNAGGFAGAKRKVEMRERDKDKDEVDDPDPLQFERAQYTMKLLGRQNAAGNWYARSMEDLRQFQFDIIDKAIDEKRKVTFLVSESGVGGGGRGGGRLSLPVRTGYDYKVMARWTTTPPLRAAAQGGMGQRWPGGGGRPGGGPGPAVPPGGARPALGSSYVLYELVRKEVAPVPETPVTTQPTRPERRDRSILGN